MKKTSMVWVNGNMIFKGQKLTIGSSAPGDHWSCYCVLDEAGKSFGTEVATTPEVMSRHLQRYRGVDRPGDGDTFPLGQPAINGAGYKSNRGARGKGAIDHQEQSKTISKTTAVDTGTRLRESIRSCWGRARHRSAQVQIHLIGDPSAGRTGAVVNGLGERGTRVG